MGDGAQRRELQPPAVGGEVTDTARKKSSISPTQRSRAYCKKQGWLSAIVEHWNPHAMIRQDAFGCVDMLVIAGGELLCVQATASGVADRMTKIREERADALVGLSAVPGVFVEVWGWRKYSPRGVKVVRWKLRRVRLAGDGTVVFDRVED